MRKSILTGLSHDDLHTIALWNQRYQLDQEATDQALSRTSSLARVRAFFTAALRGPLGLDLLNAKELFYIYARHVRYTHHQQGNQALGNNGSPHRDNILSVIALPWKLANPISTRDSKEISLEAFYLV